MNALRLIAVYAGTSCLILWLVRRYLRPISLSASAALAFLPLILAGPAVMTGAFWGALNLAYTTAPLHSRAGELPLPEAEYQNGILLDHICEVVPWRKAVREAMKTGHPPLLNRFARSGDILLGAAQPAPFHPKVWLGFLLPLATAFTFACCFTLFLAALFGFLYLAEIGLGEPAAFFGAAVWMLSGFVSFWCAWPLASVFATLPLVLLGLRRLARGVPGGFAAATAGWTLAILAGHPESLLHLTAAAGLIFLWELHRSPRRLTAIGRAVAAGLLAAALAAPALLPFLEALPQTHDFALRRAGRSLHDHSLPLGEAAASALGALYPHAWGRQWAVRDDLPARFDEATGVFAGGLALALALLACVSRRSGPMRWPFAALGLLSFAVAVGLPGVADAVGRLPLFDLALNGRLAGVAAFCLAVLAALGFEAAVASRRPRDPRFLAGTGLALLAGGVLWGWQMTRRGLDAETHHRGLLWLVLPVLLAAALAFVLRRRPRALALAWILIFLAGHRLELPRLYHRFPAELFYPPVEELAALPEEGEPYRVTGLSFAMVPAQSALFELEDVRGPQPLRHRRWTATHPLWCIPQGIWFCRVDDLTAPFLSAMNVRFAIADPETPLPRRGWRLVVRGPNAAIFENRRALPRAFVPRLVWRVPSDQKPAVTLRSLERVGDYSRVAWIEVDEGPFGRIDNGRARVVSRADGPDLRLDVRAEEPAWIVVSETFWKGWRAIDGEGREIPLRFADLAFLGLRVPAGEHRIRLVYRPRSFLWGLAIAGLAAAGLATTLPRRRRSCGRWPGRRTGRCAGSAPGPGRRRSVSPTPRGRGHRSTRACGADSES